MTASHLTGPLVVFGQASAINGVTMDVNTEAAPSVFYGGTGLIDNRAGYQPGQAVNGVAVPSWGTCQAQVLDVVPSAISAVNIAAAQVPVAATPLTLVSSTGAGITVGISVVNKKTGTTVANNLAIDGNSQTLLVFNTLASTLGPVAMYNPTLCLSRNIRITSVGNDSTATATIKGFDIYGYPMTETITLANAGIASGAKAWKFITSITPAGTLSGSNVSVGTGDVYGLPLRSDKFGDVEIYWNNAAITANTGFTAAVTSTATATTGDVRGTYAVQSSSDGTKSIQMTVTPSIVNMQSNMTTALFGVAQF